MFQLVLVPGPVLVLSNWQLSSEALLPNRPVRGPCAGPMTEVFVLYADSVRAVSTNGPGQTNLCGRINRNWGQGLGGARQKCKPTNGGVALFFKSNERMEVIGGHLVLWNPRRR